MFTEQDTIYLVDANNEEVILATKDKGHWICTLCDEDEDSKVRMLRHIRYTHIKVR